MKPRKITINDIAKELNISKSTVSRAIRNHSEINSETKKRILDYIKNIGFEPDALARSLRSGLTQTIGVVIPAYHIPFYSIAISGIQDYAFEQGYQIMICHSNNKIEIEKNNIKALLNSKVDGLIISVAEDSNTNQHIRTLKSIGLPLVMFNRVIEDIKASKVVVNDYYGAYDMTEFLLKGRKRKIIYFSGPSNLLLSANRKMGFVDAIHKNKIDDGNWEVIEGDFSGKTSYLTMKEILNKENEIDTVFCVCDEVAFGVMKAIKERNLKIPGDIAVAGFTNEPASDLVEPSLTTVDQPIYEIGRTAAKLLFNQINNDNLPAELAVLDTKLIIRNSTRLINP